MILLFLLGVLPLASSSSYASYVVYVVRQNGTGPATESEWIPVTECEATGATFGSQVWAQTLREANWKRQGRRGALSIDTRSLLRWRRLPGASIEDPTKEGTLRDRQGGVHEKARTPKLDKNRVFGV